MGIGLPEELWYSVDRNGRGSVVLRPGRPRVTLSTHWAGPQGKAYATLSFVQV